MNQCKTGVAESQAGNYCLGPTIRARSNRKTALPVSTRPKFGTHETLHPRAFDTSTSKSRDATFGKRWVANLKPSSLFLKLSVCTISLHSSPDPFACLQTFPKPRGICPLSHSHDFTRKDPLQIKTTHRPLRIPSAPPSTSLHHHHGSTHALRHLSPSYSQPHKPMPLGEAP